MRPEGGTGCSEFFNILFLSLVILVQKKDFDLEFTLSVIEYCWNLEFYAEREREKGYLHRNKFNKKKKETN